MKIVQAGRLGGGAFSDVTEAVEDKSTHYSKGKKRGRLYLRPCRPLRSWQKKKKTTLTWEKIVMFFPKLGSHYSRTSARSRRKKKKKMTNPLGKKRWDYTRPVPKNHPENTKT